MNKDELRMARIEFMAMFDADPALGIPCFEEVLRRGHLEHQELLSKNRKANAPARQLRARGIKALDLPLPMSTDFMEGCRNLFSTYTRLGRFEEAEKYRKEFFDALDEATMSESWREGLRGDFYRRSNMEAQAMPHFERSVAVATTNLDRGFAASKLASSLALVSDLDPRFSRGVMTLGQKLLSMKGLDQDARFQLFLSMEMAAQAIGDHKTVMELAAKLEALDGNLALQSQSDRMVAYCETDRWEEARDRMLKVLASLAKSKDPYDQLGYAIDMAQLAGYAAQLGRREESHGFLKKSEAKLQTIEDRLRLGPLIKMANAAFQMNDAETALKYMEQTGSNPEARNRSDPYLYLIHKLGRADELQKMREDMLTGMRENYRATLRLIAQVEATKDYVRSAFLRSMLNTGNDAKSVEAVLMVNGLNSDLKVAMLADRSSGAYESQDIDWRTQWHERRQKLQTLTLKGSNALTSEEAAEMGRLTREIASMEGAIGGTERQQAVLTTMKRTVAEWSQLLPAGSAGASFVRYDKFTPSPENVRLKDAYHTDPWYGVAVFGAGLEPQFVEIGAANEVEKLCSEFRAIVKGGNPGESVALEQVAKRLYQLVAGPIEKLLPAGKQLLYSPDGMLHLIPMNSLLDPAGAPWIAARPLWQVASFRLLEPGDDSKQAPVEGQMLLIGGVDYQAAPAGDGNLIANRDAGLRPGVAGGLQGISAKVAFAALPGTLKEVERIEKLSQDRGWQAEKFSGPDASEATIASISKHRIVHLATHGFFFSLELGAGEDGGIKSSFYRKYSDPMAYSGVALAGAQRTLEAWRKGEIPPLGSDGMLLASEVAGLKLGHVELLVLSACDTGLGSISAGEAVAGFAKACAQAGVRQTMVTLWPISDAATVSLMNDFYQKVLSGTPANEALRKAQLDHFTRLRESAGLCTAAFESMPFVLIGK